MAKTNLKLKAQVRTILGRKVKHLRKEGWLPATVYGHGTEPVSIQVNDKEMELIFAHTGESGLVDLELEGKTLPILFRNPQYHPVVGNLIHIDCYKVNLKEKITTAVPLEFIGEALGVKEGLVLVEVANEVEVEALPTDLPEKITVDLGKLVNLESQITIADLSDFDKSKVEIKNAPEQVVVKLEEPRAEEVVAPTTEEVAPGEVPATAQKEPGEEDATETETNGKKEESDHHAKDQA